jgi:hypothetical protein
MFQRSSNKARLSGLIIAPIFLLLQACGPATGSEGADDDSDAVDTASVGDEESSEEETDEVTSGEEPPDAVEATTPPSEYIEPRAAQVDNLATSQECVDCHGNDASSSAMTDDAGREIGFFDLWQGSMKANSARDPFFRAVVSAEVYRNPEHGEFIETTCLRCHSPMGNVAAERTGQTMDFTALQEEDEIGQLAIDGVSCVACHAMTDENFGTDESFNGGWTLTQTSELFGPQPAPFERPMEMRTGFVPTQSDHMQESEQCATCHTLFTETILDDGSVTEGKFPEQTPYLEWLNSSFSEGPDAQSCQDCHVPTTDQDGSLITSKIARRPDGGDFPPVEERSPYGRHLFVGGNTVVPAILRDERETTKPLATDAAFDATIDATMRQLQTQTAEVSLQNVELADGTARFDVRVENLTGHKFPTAYPSRRAWLHVRVLDARGEVLWESGAWDEDGDIEALVGLGAEEFEAHHEVVDTSEQVQIYQSVLEKPDGDATVALLHAAGYAKDNRILPSGYSTDHPEAATTAPRGIAEDSDFAAGSDVTTYRASFSGTPATVEVELAYQALGNRWLRDLFTVPTGDVQRFREMWERADTRPVIVDTATSDG